MNHQVINIIPTKKIIEAYKNVFDINVEEYLDKYEEIYLCEDRETGLKYFYPDDIAGQGKFYEILENFDWYYQSNKWEFKEARKVIKNGSLLELGSGNGDFLMSLNSSPNIQKRGLEHNLKAISICKDRGLDVDIFDLKDLPKNSLDYIVSFQVLEHISKPREFFEDSFRLLKKGGKLIVGVPNTNSLIFYPFSDSYFENGSLLLNLPPHHMGWWNKKSIRKYGKQFGFKTKSLKIEPISFFRFGLVSSNMGVLFRSHLFSKIMHKLLKRFYPYFLEGETILIVFEK
jgi:SAM-dependent methyltransferase